MDFTILVNGGPFTKQASCSAYHFAQAVLSKQHRILQVFFYLDGVMHANKLTTLPSDEMQLIPSWEQLASHGNFELVICSSAALRRGIMNDELAQRYQQAEQSLPLLANFNPSFTLAGLTQLITATCDADRFITFGD